MARLVKIRGGQEVPLLILTGHDGQNAARREEVAWANRAIDAEARRDPRLKSVLD